MINLKPNCEDMEYNFSDGSSDMYEANFMRRLTGLICWIKKW